MSKQTAPEGNPSKTIGGIDTNPRTLTNWIIREELKHKDASGSMTLLLQTIQTACKATASAIRRAGIAKLFGLSGEINETGDDQKKLDVLSNELFINAIHHSQQVCLMVSEENAKPIHSAPSGKYIIAFDPLDGSSNIDANVSVGTIFGIWRRKSKVGTPANDNEAYCSGLEIVAGGYALYGSSTMLVLTTGSGVNGFTLDSVIGEFILTHPNISIPKRGKIYSINEGNSLYWLPPTKAYIDSLKEPKEEGKKPYSLRYVGSMVADVHRTLLYGGIFAYAADKKSKNGKLRYLYEVAPMSMLMEQAGGRASNGISRCLDHTPKDIHERMGVYLGSSDDVTDLESFFKK